MALKRNKKQTLAIRQSAMRPARAITLVKTPQQPDLSTAPVLSQKAARREAHGRSLAKKAK